MAGMTRKIPKWTKAMRARAAEHGRAGGAKGNKAGKRRGGLVSWHGKTPEEQAVVLARLRAHAGRKGAGRNRSSKARAAQRARGLAGMKRLTAAKARFLADMGMIGRAPLPASILRALRPPTGPTPVAPSIPSKEAFLNRRIGMYDLEVWEAAKAAWRREWQK